MLVLITAQQLTASVIEKSNLFFFYSRQLLFTLE